MLPPTGTALGHLAPEPAPNASSLFNLTRNLGGAIGIALIDTARSGYERRCTMTIAMALAAIARRRRT